MSVRSIVVVMLSLLCGASAAWGINQMRPDPPPPATQEVEVETVIPTTPVVVTVEAVPRGRFLAEEQLELRDWPTELLPEGAFSEIEEVAGQLTIGPMIAGEPVLDGKVAHKDSGRGLATMVTPGMRAYTIQARGVATNVAGFVLPGNRVDVLLTLRDSGRDDESGGGSTTTLLQSVELLAVGQLVDPPDDEMVAPGEVRSVTVLVTPDQAAMLDLGQSVGQLSLALRNPEDAAEALTTPALLSQIRYRQEKPIEPEPEPVETVAYVEPNPEPQRREIVTLRGRNRGSVWVTQD